MSLQVVLKHLCAAQAEHEHAGNQELDGDGVVDIPDPERDDESYRVRKLGAVPVKEVAVVSCLLLRHFVHGIVDEKHEDCTVSGQHYQVLVDGVPKAHQAV